MLYRGRLSRIVCLNAPSWAYGPAHKPAPLTTAYTVSPKKERKKERKKRERQHTFSPFRIGRRRSPPLSSAVGRSPLAREEGDHNRSTAAAASTTGVGRLVGRQEDLRLRCVVAQSPHPRPPPTHGHRSVQPARPPYRQGHRHCHYSVSARAPPSAPYPPRRFTAVPH
jgi:hypothetical protein